MLPLSAPLFEYISQMSSAAHEGEHVSVPSQVHHVMMKRGLVDLPILCCDRVHNMRLVAPEETQDLKGCDPNRMSQVVPKNCFFSVEFRWQPIGLEFAIACDLSHSFNANTI